MKDIEINWKQWSLRLFKERQVYYSLFPVVWQPDYMRRTGLLFEFLRFRMAIQKTHKDKCSKCGKWRYIIHPIGHPIGKPNTLCDSCLKEAA